MTVRGAASMTAREGAERARRRARGPGHVPCDHRRRGARGHRHRGGGRPRVLVPVVVVELLLGCSLGPQVLGLHVNQFITFFSDLGLGLLFFFAGYEIDLHRIMGRPLRLALLGWALSLALAYTIGGVLAAAGDRAVAPVHGLGAGDDGDRHADPDPLRHRRAAHALRHLPARRPAPSASSARSCC